MKASAIFIFIFLQLLACSSGKKENNFSNATSKDLEQPLLKANRGLVSKENEEINAFIKRRNWNMLKTGSGLRYMIYEKGNGISAEKGKYAQIKYVVSLLNGSECYRSKDKPERFMVDQDNVESGLHEGIKLLHTGDKAIFILPPHLAHGLIGDQAKIPPLSSIVYDIELVAVN